jgi:hypothetical protein
MNNLKPLPAIYNGYQEGTADFAGFELWTPVVEWDGHPAYSTFSLATILRAGFRPYNIKENKS